FPIDEEHASIRIGPSARRLLHRHRRTPTQRLIAAVLDAEAVALFIGDTRFSEAAPVIGARASKVDRTVLFDETGARSAAMIEAARFQGRAAAVADATRRADRTTRASDLSADEFLA